MIVDRMFGRDLGLKLTPSRSTFVGEAAMHGHRQPLAGVSGMYVLAGAINSRCLIAASISTVTASIASYAGSKQSSNAAVQRELPIVWAALAASLLWMGLSAETPEAERNKVLRTTLIFTLARAA